jgi:pyruvate formate lyase activating enzyme
MEYQPVIPKAPTGLVLNIQHFCTDDGPGIRTNVFLKACSLRCKWCSNPESIHRKPELAYNLSKCIGVKECGFCLRECPESAIYVLDSDGKVRVNWTLCTDCGRCVEVCPPHALYLFGQEMTVEEILDEVEQDSTFYRESGGGITVSGGECLLQPDFVVALLEGAHQRGFTTAIETAGNVPWANMEKVLPHVDTMLHDHKLTDPERHRKWCGADNTRILANFKKAYETFPDTTFIARTPLIPGVNDDEEHIRSVLAFIQPHANVINYQLLPYHRFGESKYRFLGRVYELKDFTSPAPETLQRLRGIIDEAFGRKGAPTSVDGVSPAPPPSSVPIQHLESSPELSKGVEQPTLNAVVTLRNEVSPWLMVLRVVPDGWDYPEFAPGQFTYLGLPGSASRCALAEPEPSPPEPDKLIRRTYAIASSPLNREFLEFYIALVPTGTLSPRLFDLKIGDRIWLSEKVGGRLNLYQVPEDANVVLMATGSGLAPFLSMLSTHLKISSRRKVAVLHGARHSWDLGYRSILMTMQDLRDNFTYLPVISRPDEEPVPWKGSTGHVQYIWKSGAVEKAWGVRPAPENTHVLLCGAPDMIEEMVSTLVEAGFKEHTRHELGQIHAERYWHGRSAPTPST